MGVVSWSQIDEHLHEEKLCDETLHDETFVRPQGSFVVNAFPFGGRSRFQDFELEI